MQAELVGILDSGEPVHRLVLDVSGLRAAVLTYGGIIERLEVPDRAGRMANVVLGLGSLAEYSRDSPYLGAIVGRYANRIAAGRFWLDGREHRLVCNNGPNSLHGGMRGFDKRVWQVTAADRQRVQLSYVSPDGEEGYPGTLRVGVGYTLGQDRSLRISYRAETDRPTVLNLSNHSYWNLAGEGTGTALDHALELAADHFCPVDPTAIPTGEVRSVEDTPFDFRQKTRIGAHVRASDPQLLIGRGYDHNWVLRGGVTSGPRLAARLSDPSSGRMLEVLTDQPGLQFYSGNFLDGSLVGASGRAYRQGDGVVLETQHFPDSPNHPHFPSTVLRPGEVFRSSTLLRFSVID